MAENILKKVSKSITNTFNLKTENIPFTKESKKKQEDMEVAQKVFEEWDNSFTIYNQLFTRMSESRDFYLGDKSQQWGLQPEGDIQLVFNIGATIIDLFTYILSNNPPYIQFVPDGTDKIAQLRADFGENLTRKLLDNAQFHKRFRDAVKGQFMLGLVWLYPLWNPKNKDGGDKGTWEISVLNQFTTRVRYAGNDYEKILSFITEKRMLPSEIKNLYDFEAIPDSASQILPQSFSLQDDGMTTVFNRYDEKEIITVVNGRKIGESRKHGLDIVPVVQVNNIIVPNDAHGHAEDERWKQTAQEINLLLTAASEIARDLGWPALLEYNNALGGRKPPKLRGQKIPVRRSDKGEAIAYLNNPAQIAPLLKQAEMLLDLFHFISLMPKAAAGIFEPSITSGFQAKLAMQPATLTTENRKIDWNVAIKQLVKMAIKMIEEFDPKSLEVEISKNKTFKFDNLSEHEMEIVWPENLPIDIAREIQNLVLGIQNNLTSAHQAIEKYNVLMGVGAPTDTLDYLNQEADMPELTPERALKVAEVREKLKGLTETIQGANNKLGELRTQLQPEQTPNPVNQAREATSPLPEEERVTSETAEAVPLESTGGVLPREGEV